MSASSENRAMVGSLAHGMAEVERFHQVKVKVKVKVKKLSVPHQVKTVSRFTRK